MNDTATNVTYGSAYATGVPFEDKVCMNTTQEATCVDDLVMLGVNQTYGLSSMVVNGILGFPLTINASNEETSYV